ncbi:hypothetical protein ThimaDRAFT_4767 [Thiocapsa marina 5811]|uniref:Uncharacterized protein n=2 Tax=Thiocapsa marina TaxID=244573 RepID=F9UIL4_9GAMM|nr:hypothetical protein ThimaDRAFT_4767 [Thiocapsa marina 5811]
MEKSRKDREELLNNFYAHVLQKFDAWKATRRGEDQGYRIEGLHVVAGDLEEPVYIRDLLDVGSCEFSSCAMSGEKRLEIISELDLESLTATLEECFLMKGYDPDRAEFNTMLAILSLLGKSSQSI